MFHTPLDARFGVPPSFDRLFAHGESPLRFPAGMDLCREQAPAAVDCDGLRFAAEVRKSSARDAFRPAFAPGDWRVLSSFCIARRLPPDYRLVIPGRSDRALRFVVEGTLWLESVAPTPTLASRPALLQPGTMLGEESLFSDEPCDLDVRTLESALVLELSLPRQKELTAACPEIAFELLRAAGAAIAARARAAEAQARPALN